MSPKSKHSKQGRISGVEWIKRRNKMAAARLQADKDAKQKQMKDHTERIMKEMEAARTPLPKPKKEGKIKRTINRLKNK